jgi:hypothetical protein
MADALSRCHLDLSGAVVLTEAASGYYVVTPLLAAMARAERVYAYCRTTAYGTAKEVAAQTHGFARLLGVEDRIHIVFEKSPAVLAQADIVTNSGHLRPLDAETIHFLKPTAVIPLMYEAWEFRSSDVDLEACRARGIRIAGTNERHPAIDVFSYLGPMAVKLLHDAGVPVYGSRILLLCDNPFARFLKEGLARAGASVDVHEALPTVSSLQPHDAIVVALRPRTGPVISRTDTLRIAHYWQRAIVAQFWGDLDRASLAEQNIPCAPLSAPAAGHMGVLPSCVGPEPVIRLQTGGLKTAEVLMKFPSATDDERSFVQMM